jgi:hypothetical protein
MRLLRRIFSRIWARSGEEARNRWMRLTKDNSFKSYYLNRHIVQIQVEWAEIHIPYLYLRVIGQLIWWVVKVIAFFIFCWFLAFWYLE